MNNAKSQHPKKKTSTSDHICQLLIEATRDYAIFMLDPKGIIISWNVGAQRLNGYKEKEILGKHFSIFFNSEDIKKHHPENELKIAKKEGQYQEEGWRVKKNGSQFWAHVVINTIRDKNGKLLGFAKILQDLTERKKSQELLIKKNEELRHANVLAIEANHAKSAFLSAMSHEIRTTLNGIIIMTELLMASPLTAEQLEDLELMRISENQLLAIINNILDFSKIEAQSVDINIKDFNLTNLLNNVIKEMEQETRQKELTFYTDIGNEVPKLVRGDPLKLTQILNNILNNALKFTKKGSITFKVHQAHASYPADSKILKKHKRIVLLFEIVDTGIGISAKTLRQLFQPYSQGNPSITKTYGGSGLGLTISKKLIEKMEGIFEVESKPGIGSRFWFILPFAPSKNKLQDTKPQPLKTLITTKKLKYKILLAEDNEINQLITIKILKKLGYQTDVVNNGLEAVNLTQKNSYDLILMDCQMPKMDGYKATKLIRSYEMNTGKHIPIIALTAHALKDDKETCLTAGMDDYISKPVDLKKLMQILIFWLDQKNKSKPHVSLIDEQRIHDAFGNNSSLIKKFFCSFLDSTEKCLLKIKKAIKNKNYNGALQYLHTLKGSASNSGVIKLSELCSKTMENISQENWEAANKNYRKIRNLVKQVHLEATKKFNC